ncbi:MAG: type II secretion system protein [Nitrospinota bacterium]
MMKKSGFKNYKIRNLKSKIQNQGGFTLIELAIVMVIIGIILGAVLKGQDLIANARAKKAIQWVKEWETAEWSYFDRKGRFAGDGTSSNGVIGDVAGEQTATTDAVYEITNANFINTPAATISLGSITFYVFIGHNNETSDKNVIVICKESDAVCDTTLASDELLYLESIDTSIDGTADVAAGNVRAITASTSTGAGIAIDAVTEDGAAGAWDTSNTGLVYYYDRPHS